MLGGLRRLAAPRRCSSLRNRGRPGRLGDGAATRRPTIPSATAALLGQADLRPDQARFVRARRLQVRGRQTRTIRADRRRRRRADGECRARGRGGRRIVDCARSLAIDLPPGIVDRRRAPQPDGAMSIMRSALGGSGEVIQLRNAAGLINALAALRARRRELASAAADAAAPPESSRRSIRRPCRAPDRPNLRRHRHRQPPARASIAPARAPAASRRSARDPGLAALDRQMAAQYQRAVAGSDARPQAAALRQTRDRFLAYRDNCPNIACIAEAYAAGCARSRDIVAGRWQPPR